MTITTTNNLTWIDAVIIGIYFLLILLVGLWSSRKSKGNVRGYFLASRNMNWIPVGASLFASNIGAVHFIGLAGSGAASGIAVAGFEFCGPFFLSLLGWVFVPVYLSSRIYTMPEYLQKRFGGQRIRVYLSLLSLLLAVTTKIAADLYAGALFIQMALNRTSSEWLYIGILILLGIASLFTILGGLTAVIWTDFVQTILMLLGSFTLMIISMNAVGGYEELVEKYPYSYVGNNSCGVPRSDYMNLLRSPHPGESDLPWTGMIFGLAINATWYFCTDQVIVQRTLASKNLTHAKGGCILASYLKLLPFGLMVLPGMAARVLFPEVIGCTDPIECKKICGIAAGCSNTAYIQLVLRLLPTGLCGIMLAVMLSALMSSLTSILNSASTIFTIDLWSRIRKNASDVERVVVGRMFVLVVAFIAVLWIPLIQGSPNSKLFDYMQSIIGYLASPICVVYLLAVFYPRANEQGVFTGLMCGLATGVTRFIIELAFPAPVCGSDIIDDRPFFIIAIVDKIHYLHFTILQFFIVGIIIIGVSLITEPIPKQCLYRLTFWSRHSLEERQPIDTFNDIRKNRTMTNKSTDMEMECKTPGSEDPSEKTTQNSPSLITKIVSFFETKNQQEDITETEKEDLVVQNNDFLVEDPKWKMFVDVNAVICIVVATFVIGFFS